MRFARKYLRCPCAIPKPTPFCQQRSCPPWCRFSLQSFNSSHQNWKKCVRGRFARNYVRCARVRSQSQQQNFVGNAHVLLHADFRCNPPLLAIINCERAFWGASGVITRAGRVQSQNQQQHFVGNAYVPLHADFGPNWIILATTLGRKTANSCELPTKPQSFYCGPYGPKLTKYKELNARFEVIPVANQTFGSWGKPA